MSLVNRLDRDSTYDQRLRHVLTERSSTSSSRRGMKRAPGSRNGISVRARSGRSGGERFSIQKGTNLGKSCAHSRTKSR